MFICETRTATSTARSLGRARRGERLRRGIRNGHGKTTAFPAALTLPGTIAPFVPPGAINRDAFVAEAETVRAPELRSGASVVEDRLRHGCAVQLKGRCALIEAGGVRPLALPRLLPTRHPIETAFVRLKALLGKAAERTVDGLRAATGRILERSLPREGANHFSARR